MNNKCFSCLKLLSTRHQIKYCSNKCQKDQQYHAYISKWKNGLNNGVIGITSKTISAHIRRYLLEKNNYKCSQCGWNKIHPITNNVPLEIDHCDGNAENNNENNLQLLCPNCHSLTHNFRNLNKSSSRSWRINNNGDQLDK